MESLKPVLSDYVINHDAVYQAILETLLKFASDRMSLYGKEELFNQPEFKNDSDKLLKVLQLLNNSSVLKEVGNEDKESSIKIGDIDGNQDISMVSHKINVGKDGKTTIALVGPTRMDYDKAMSALEYFAEELQRYFEGEDLDDDNGGKHGDA